MDVLKQLGSMAPILNQKGLITAGLVTGNRFGNRRG